MSASYAKSEFCTNEVLEKIKKIIEAKQAIIFAFLLKPFDFKYFENSKTPWFKPLYSEFGKEKAEIMPFDKIVEPIPIEKYIQKYCSSLSDKIKDAVVKSKIVSKSKMLIVHSGKILHNIPDEMEVNKTISCRIKIASNEKLLCKDNEDSKENTKTLEIGSQMAVSLKAFMPTDFNIFEFSACTQNISAKSVAEWNFSTSPLKLGVCSLYIEAYIVSEFNERITLGCSLNISVKKE